MALHLGKAVVAGGIVYPAGTAATPDLRVLIDDRHWVGEDSADTAAFEQAIAERDTKLAELNAENTELRAEIGRLNAQIGGGGQQAEVEPSLDPGYGDQTVEALQTEADKRGLEVEGTGKGGNVLKSDLVSALKADDEA